MEKLKIEVKKINLTKAMISQMFFIKTANIEKARVLGMLLNVRKNHPKVMLLEFKNDYYLYDMRWKLSGKEFYYTIGNSVRSIHFDSIEECQHNWKIFTKARDDALKNHIYI